MDDRAASLCPRVVSAGGLSRVAASSGHPTASLPCSSLRVAPNGFHASASHTLGKVVEGPAWPSHGMAWLTMEKREIWRVGEAQVREILRRRRLRLSDDEKESGVKDLPLYSEAALTECVVLLARQHMRRCRGNGEQLPGLSQ